VKEALRVAIVPELAQRDASLADWWGSESVSSDIGSVDELGSCLAFDSAAAKMLPPFPIKPTGSRKGKACETHEAKETFETYETY
jgi:hypothetical protein